MTALFDRIDALAADVGRLRRTLEATSPAPTSTATRRSREKKNRPLRPRNLYLVDRIAEELETLDVMLHPSAGEIVRWLGEGALDPEIVQFALTTVDERSQKIRRLLGTVAA